MPDKAAQQQILDDILESPDFKGSQRYCDVLRYLVEESLAERVPKEVTIGMQFFGKDGTFNSREDASVRVFLTNLRKKLEHYHLTNSKPFAYRLQIPVGHYKVEFVPNTVKVNGSESTYMRLLMYGFIPCIALAFFAGYFARTPDAPQSAPIVPNPVWNEFVDPQGKPTLIVLGDYFFLRERGSGNSYYRTTTINTPEDYRERLLQDPGFAKRYEQNDFTFLRPSASWGLFHILPILRTSPKGVSLKLASQFSNDDFKSNNVIFIGSLKSLFGIRKFLHLFNITYSLQPSRVTVGGFQNDSLVEFSRSNQRGGGYEKDYAIIAKNEGPDGSTVLLLLGIADTGVIEATHAICDPMLLKAVEKKYPLPSRQDPFNFTLVIGSEGMTQTIFNSDIRCFVANKPLQRISDLARKDSLKAE